MLMMQSKITLQAEYYQPLYLQLKLEPKDKKRNGEESEELEHLPGYLPDGVKKKKRATVARMQIPFDQLPFIKHTFGDKIDSGKGCLLECLYSIVKVFVDPTKNLCKLNIPSWSHLEDLNVRRLSF